MKIMKKYTALFCILLLFVACDNDYGCFKTTGTLVSQEFLVDPFDKIIVYEGIELYIKESLEQKIVVETDKDLLSGIHLTVNDRQLEITNNNDCDFFRNVGLTKVYIYVSNITHIRNSSTFPVHSIGVLNFDTLHLISEDYLSDYFNSGDFNLEVNSQTINIVANGPSNHTISGLSETIHINFAGSNPRFEGSELLVKNATLFARSTNDILIKVSEKISGSLYSTGDVVLLKKPLIIDLKEYYKGKVIHNY